MCLIPVKAIKSADWHMDLVFWGRHLVQQCITGEGKRVWSTLCRGRYLGDGVGRKSGWDYGVLKKEIVNALWIRTVCINSNHRERERQDIIEAVLLKEPDVMNSFWSSELLKDARKEWYEVWISGLLPIIKGVLCCVWFMPMVCTLLGS